MWGKDHRHESGNRGRYCNSLRRNDSIHCEQTTFSLQDQLTKQNKTRAWFAGADVAMAPTCSAHYLSVRTLCTRALAKPPSFPLIFPKKFSKKHFYLKPIIEWAQLQNLSTHEGLCSLLHFSDVTHRAPHQRRHCNDSRLPEISTLCKQWSRCT